MASREQTDELLDVIAGLLAFSRAGTLHADDGEDEAWVRARAVLSRYGYDNAAACDTSSTTVLTPC